MTRRWFFHNMRLGTCFIIFQTLNVDGYMKCKFINIIALILIVIGAINWGLVGFAQFDLVAYIFGGSSAMLARVVYALVGLAGLWSLSFVGRCCKCKCGCGSSCKR